MEFLPRFGPSAVANASGSMPFRLLSASPARCGAVTRSGAQCAINAGSSLRDGSGKLVSEPLRRGGPHCMFHMSLFETKAAAVCGGVYISSYKELNPSKSPFRIDPSPGNAELV